MNRPKSLQIIMCGVRISPRFVAPRSLFSRISLFFLPRLKRGCLASSTCIFAMRSNKDLLQDLVKRVPMFQILSKQVCLKNIQCPIIPRQDLVCEPAACNSALSMLWLCCRLGSTFLMRSLHSLAKLGMRCSSLYVASVRC